MKMGLQPLAIQDWIEIDDQFSDQLQRKTELFREHEADVFVSLPTSRLAQQEVLFLLRQHLLDYFPSHYQQQGNSLQNRLTGQTWSLQDEPQPLALASRWVQEDLCLLQQATPAPQADLAQDPYCLTAASVCFPSRWNLRSKLGQPLSQIHQPVPDYQAKLSRPVDQVFARLRTDYPAYRFNWSILETPELFLPQSLPYAGEPITAANAGELLWLRVERQTLRRLPQTQAILFTIRTYVTRLDQVLTSPQIAQQLAATIQQIPPTLQSYKSLLPFRAALLDYLTIQTNFLG
jgi:dimethylamine monooxygenase subunit A